MANVKVNKLFNDLDTRFGYINDLGEALLYPAAYFNGTPIDRKFASTLDRALVGKNLFYVAPAGRVSQPTDEQRAKLVSDALVLSKTWNDAKLFPVVVQTQPAQVDTVVDVTKKPRLNDTTTKETSL